MSLKIKYLFTFLAYVALTQLNAQGSNINSPFSRFGIGDLLSESPMSIRQMGGVGTSFIDAYHANFDNPASLAHLRSTAFDVGIALDYAKLKDANNESSHWYGNLGYLSLAFPMRNPLNEVFSREKHEFFWSMGFAVMPNSRTSYAITSEGENEAGPISRNFTGSGGSYKAMWSNALKYKNLSLGVNLGALFGKFEYERSISFPGSAGAYNDEFNTSYSMSSLYAKFGLIYLQRLNKASEENVVNPNAKLLSFGLTYKPNLSVATEADISNLAVQRLGAVILADTLQSSLGMAGMGTLPAELGFGITYYSGNAYGISLDIRRTFWSNYKMDPAPEQFSNTTRLAVGGFWKPDYDDINNFFNRVSYKLGVYLEEDPRLINGDQISSYGLTLGLGMPLSWQRKFSNLDLGVTIGKRSVDNILSESFAKITMGFTFNDSDWFIKRKFN
jgi:hypothetical protein